MSDQYFKLDCYDLYCIKHTIGTVRAYILFSRKSRIHFERRFDRLHFSENFKLYQGRHPSCIIPYNLYGMFTNH